jgi:hypothetical protein
VGKCDEYVLRLIYKFLIEILAIEYENIRQNFGDDTTNSNNESIKNQNIKDKKKKIRKKNIMVSSNP